MSQGEIGAILREVWALANSLRERPDVMIIPTRNLRLMARLAVRSRMGEFGLLTPEAMAEARAYLARKAARRRRMARKKRRGWM